MAKQHAEISENQQKFIEKQKMFFVATAGPEGRINLSPKGYDVFRVLNKHQVIWLNLTGSGNETAAHLLENGRITIMFCSFEGSPLILRLYGQGTAVHEYDPSWAEYSQHFAGYPGMRQLILVDVDLVQTSCGFGVPLFDFVADREKLNDDARAKGPEGVREYWAKHNITSLDGKPTLIFKQ